MRNLGFLTAAVLFVAMFAAFGWAGSVAGQEPPVGNPPEPDDDLMRQIAELLLSGAAGVEEDPQLWDLIKQLQPDQTFTLGVDPGGEPVGGVAELPDVKGTPLQVADSTGSRMPLIVGIAVGLAALGSIAWYMRRRVVPEP